ncbi:MAG: shikimate dehydrogenase [Actinomycetes bacterium]|jgi:shikimate dehydrogenase
MSKPNFLSKLTGSFSTPADGNPTVAMVEAAYKAANLNIRYINTEVFPDGLQDAVIGARAMNWLGFNLSAPHKVSVIPMLDGLGESASIMGAVNCVVNRDGKLIGENTDGKGFLTAFSEVLSPEGKTICIFGAGGAARAIAVELALVKAKKIIVVNRNVERGEDLVDTIRTRTSATAEFIQWTPKFSIPVEVDAIVNATTIGMEQFEGKELDIDFDSIRSGMVVSDVIVNPPNTHLLQQAAKRGAVTIDGVGMLVYQGIIGIKYWTGLDSDQTVMRKTLEEIR